MGKLINNQSKQFGLKAVTLLENAIPKWDYHIHTSFTDGKHTVEENVLQAHSIGMERIIFTEHTEPWHAHYETWFGDYVDQVTHFKNAYKGKMEILIGVECPAIDFEGNLEITDEMRKHADYILGAAHRYPFMEGRRVRDLEKQEAVELEHQTLLGLTQNAEVDAIAHIGATCSKYCGSFPEELTRDIVRSATRKGIAIELNHWYHQPIDQYLKIFEEEDACITLGSNAHDKEQIGSVGLYLENS